MTQRAIGGTTAVYCKIPVEFENLREQVLPLKIAAIADTHYAIEDLDITYKRRRAIADILLLRTVHRLKRFIRPDIVLLLGDLVDSGSGTNAIEEHKRIKEIIDLLECPVLVIPGNHDGDIDAFYSVYPRPPETLDINDVRLVTFIDPEEPHYNAHRTEADIGRMTQAREGWDGPIVSIQHVPLFSPGTSPSPYHYLNADELWSIFEENNYTLSISGHYHAGDDQIGRDAGKAVIVPALCESPFPFYEIIIDGEKVETKRHELMIPQELDLVDYHVHTPFAYCQENMNIARSIELARELGLAGLAFTEHSGQLYFDRNTFWGAEFMLEGIKTSHGWDNRMPEYLRQAQEQCPPAIPGLEIDCDYSGNPVIFPEDFEKAQVRIGSIHWLEELRKPEQDMRQAGEELIRRLSNLLPQGIQILAHPFRVFNRTQSEVPGDVLPRMIELLRTNGVAAEVNFHTQETTPEFVKMCVESGVKLVFGSDSHNLYEVGELYPHLELIKRCGYSYSDLTDILADLRPAGWKHLKEQ